MEAAVRRAVESGGGEESGATGVGAGGGADEDPSTSASTSTEPPQPGSSAQAIPGFFAMFSLFEGSPSYKQRRKKTGTRSGLRSVSVDGYGHGEYARGRRDSSESFDFDDTSSLHSHVSAAEAFMVQARGRRDAVGYYVPGNGGNNGYDSDVQFPGVSGSYLPMGARGRSVGA